MLFKSLDELDQIEIIISQVSNKQQLAENFQQFFKQYIYHIENAQVEEINSFAESFCDLVVRCEEFGFIQSTNIIKIFFENFIQKNVQLNTNQKNIKKNENKIFSIFESVNKLTNNKGIFLQNFQVVVQQIGQQINEQNVFIFQRYVLFLQEIAFEKYYTYMRKRDSIVTFLNKRDEFVQLFSNLIKQTLFYIIQIFQNQSFNNQETIVAILIFLRNFIKHVVQNTFLNSEKKVEITYQNCYLQYVVQNNDFFFCCSDLIQKNLDILFKFLIKLEKKFLLSFLPFLQDMMRELVDLYWLMNELPHYILQFLDQFWSLKNSLKFNNEEDLKLRFEIVKFVGFFQLSENSIEQYLKFLNQIYSKQNQQNFNIKEVLVDYNACFASLRDIEKKLVLIRVLYPIFREMIQENQDTVFQNMSVFLEILFFYQNLLDQKLYNIVGNKHKNLIFQMYSDAINFVQYMIEQLASQLQSISEDTQKKIFIENNFDYFEQVIEYLIVLFKGFAQGIPVYFCFYQQNFHQMISNIILIIHSITETVLEKYPQHIENITNLIIELFTTFVEFIAEKSSKKDFEYLLKILLKIFYYNYKKTFQDQQTNLKQFQNFLIQWKEMITSSFEFFNLQKYMNKQNNETIQYFKEISFVYFQSVINLLLQLYKEIQSQQMINSVPYTLYYFIQFYGFGILDIYFFDLNIRLSQDESLKSKIVFEQMQKQVKFDNSYLDKQLLTKLLKKSLNITQLLFI